MEDTYTYVARSAHDPTKVATFTAYDGVLTVDVGAPLEQLQRTFQAVGDDKLETQDSKSIKAATPWLTPVAVRLVEQGIHPFNVADMDASTDGNDLNVKLWVRTGGLRLVPVTLAWDEVDNPDATQAFVKELDRRKKAAAHPGRFRGVMDYWVSWMAAGFVLIFWLFRQFRRENA